MTARELHDLIQPLFPGKYVVVNESAHNGRDYFSAAIYNRTADGKGDFINGPICGVLQVYSETDLISECKKMAEGENNDSSKT